MEVENLKKIVTVLADSFVDEGLMAVMPVNDGTCQPNPIGLMAHFVAEFDASKNEVEKTLVGDLVTNEELFEAVTEVIGLMNEGLKEGFHTNFTPAIIGGTTH